MSGCKHENCSCNASDNKVKVKKFDLSKGKVIIFALCLFGLSYQTFVLIKQYTGGQTVVNIKIEKLGFSQIPAITICYPIFTSFEKMAELFPEFSKEYAEYKSIINNVEDIDLENKTLVKIFESIALKGYEMSLLAFKSMSVLGAFNNISIPFNFPNRPVNQIEKGNRNSTTSVAIRATVSGSIHSESKFVNRKSYIDDKPIESISSKLGRFSPRKCFTFFSEYQNQWKDVRMKIKNFYFTIFLDNYWFPPKFFHYYFSMHSPNTLPEMESEDNYIKLKGGHSYHIFYSRIKTKLLGPNYLTNCRNYNISNINEDQSRSDCIDKCVLKGLKQNCGHCLHHTGALYKKDFVQTFGSDKLCDPEDTFHCHLNSMDEIEPKCESQCRPDCDYQFIDFDIKDDQRIGGSQWNKMVNIAIKHSLIPDQIIEHLPGMPFITFIANFGGLAGMWLGLSAIALYDFILRFIK